MGARGRVPWTWLALGLFLLLCLRPLSGNWSTAVIAPFGGLDALFQAGLLEWGVRHVWHPAVWRDLPIFHPAETAIAFMDPLTAQAVLVTPLRWLGATPAALYNAAWLISLVLAGAATAALWRATGGGARAGALAALALIGSPYTLSQLGHLNQLPPPGVPAALAALACALAAWERGAATARAWGLLAGVLVIQAAMGWYGFAYACLALAVVLMIRLPRLLRRPGRRRPLLSALPPLVLAAAGVWLLAAPHLETSFREPEFTRHLGEVRWFSADAQHLLNTGAYRAGPADWAGRGVGTETRHHGVARQVLHPGWTALLLAGLGFAARGALDARRRAWGYAILAAGAVGLVLAFGDSVGLPGGERRLTLPMGWLQRVFEPARAYRAVWRFSFLFTLAVAWWAAVGWSRLASLPGRRGRFLSVGAVLVLVLESAPVSVPVLVLADQTRTVPHRLTDEAALTLPAAPDVYGEDLREARWLWRSLASGRPVTGGVSGWVPPWTRELRRRLATCEDGQEDPDALFAELAATGVTRVEMFVDDADDRLAYWREILRARVGAPVLEGGVEVYDLPPVSPPPRR